MDKPTRPTNYDEIIPWLRAKADPRVLQSEGEIHYLFGMATIIIADAHAEMARLERRVAALEPSYAALLECHDLLDDYSDVKDGEDGPVPNRAMSLLTDVEAALRKADAR